MKRFALFLVLSSFIAGETYSMSCRGTCKIRVPGGSYEEDVVQDITKPKTWDNKVTVKVPAHDETRDVTMPTVPDNVKSLAEARSHMDNFCASHFKNYTGMSSVVSCNFPPTAEEIKAEKKAQKDWEIQQKKEEAEAALKQKKYNDDQDKIKIAELAAQKKDKAAVNKIISSLAPTTKCAPGEVAISAGNPQTVKLSDSRNVVAYQGCAKKSGKSLVLSSGVVNALKGKEVYIQVSNGAMNGTAVGVHSETGTKLTFANNKIVSGVYTKKEWTNDGNYRGDLKEVTTYAGDKITKKFYQQETPEYDLSDMFLASEEEHIKGKLVSRKQFSADGKLKEENHWNSKGELFGNMNVEGQFKDFSCVAKPNYQDKKSFYKHCVDEDYYSSITKVFSKLDEKYPEMKKVQHKLKTTFKIRYDENKKCILKSESKKTSVKLNPDMKYTDSQYDYTIDKDYKFSSQDDDEIYTILTSAKGLREVCSTIATEPRSKSMGKFGKLKKAVYCKEAPPEDEIIAN